MKKQNNITAFEAALKNAVVKEGVHINSLKTSYDSAIDFGDALNALKEITLHGNFESLCKEHFSLSPQQCRKYMSAAANKDSIRSLRSDLDLNSTLMLLTVEADEGKRVELADEMAGMSQKERGKFLTEIKQLKTQRDDYKDESVKYRGKLRDSNEALEKLKAEKAKIVYKTDDEEAIKQIREEAETKVKLALEQKLAAQQALQTEATRIAEYRLKDRKDEVESLEARAERAQAKTDEQLSKLAIIEQQVKRTAAEYDTLLGKQARRVQVESLLDQWAKIEGELGVVITELFFDDIPLEPDQHKRAMTRLKISQETRDQVMTYLSPGQRL